MQFKGHSLRVDQAAPKGGKGAVVFDPQRSLCAGNLAHDIEVRTACLPASLACLTCLPGLTRLFACLRVNCIACLPACLPAIACLDCGACCFYSCWLP